MKEFSGRELYPGAYPYLTFFWGKLPPLDPKPYIASGGPKLRKMPVILFFNAVSRKNLDMSYSLHSLKAGYIGLRI